MLTRRRIPPALGTRVLRFPTRPMTPAVEPTPVLPLLARYTVRTAAPALGAEPGDVLVISGGRCAVLRFVDEGAARAAIHAGCCVPEGA